jgi:hypothetical protein
LLQSRLAQVVPVTNTALGYFYIPPLFNPATVAITRYRYRGSVIPTPWPST